MTTAPASARFEFRLRPDSKRLIERAAALVHENASDFARTAAEERAERVLREHLLVTIVPQSFFDELLNELEAAPVPNAALRKAAKRARRVVRRG